jgi:YHS domain-containing protein
MRTTLVALSWIVLGAAVTSCHAPAPPPATAASTVVVAAVRPPGEATVGDRTTCPVSGEEFVISATSPHVEYEGKTYYFCCADCVQRFTAQPAAYIREKGRVTASP